MNKQEFDAFFQDHARNVDNANRQGFWHLTDSVIETFLLEVIEERSGITLVDFGGGTGRWLELMDKHLENSKLVLVDLSEDMLAQAEKRVKEGLYDNEIQLVHGNIESLSQVPNNSADYIMSTYNPLSFTNMPQAAVDESYRILKPGGKTCLTVQGYYNALYSKLNNSLAAANELEEIFSSKKVRWNTSVPALWQLTRSDMEELFENSGYQGIYCRGIAVVTQPQGEDFDPSNKQIGPLSSKLNGDAPFRAQVLKMELAAGRDQSAIDRAMNIMTIGTK